MIRVYGSFGMDKEICVVRSWDDLSRLIVDI